MTCTLPCTLKYKQAKNDLERLFILNQLGRQKGAFETKNDNMKRKKHFVFHSKENFKYTSPGTISNSKEMNIHTPKYPLVLTLHFMNFEWLS